MALTYVNIATTTLTTATNLVNFSNIASDYTDLAVRITARSDRNLVQDDCQLYLNNSNSNLSGIVLYNPGSTTSIYTTFQPWVAQPAANTASNYFNNAEFYIPSYAVTGMNRPMISSGTAMANGTTAPYALLSYGAHAWEGQTAVVNRVTVFAGSNFVAGTTVSLYGIKRA